MGNLPLGQKQVFISHSSKNVRWVRTRLEGPLRNRNLSVSVFYEFDPTQTRNENMAAGIRSSQYFLAVLTDYWFESPWCFDHEFKLAGELGKTICAVQIEEIKQEYKAIFFPSWINLSAPETFTAELERLFEALGVGSKEAGGEALPAPTAPYDPVGPPTATSAISLLPVECPGTPFDVGTIWGLPRVPLVGVLSAPAHVRILDALVRTERALLDAQFRGIGDRLPDRWWIECSVTDYPNGPSSLSDLWASAVRVTRADAAMAENALAGYLKRCGLHPAMRFGCVLTVGDRVDDIRSVQQWCRQLADLIPDVAIVVQIVAQTLAASSRSALGLAESLKRQDFPVPVEVFEWRGSYPCASDATTSVKRDRTPDASTEVGAWLGLALQRTTVAELSRVAPALRRIGVAPAAQDKSGPRSCETVEALDAAAAPADVYRELLQLVAAYVPERMEDLLNACGASDRAPTHREAILAASTSDAWIDAYVSGVNWQSSGAFDPARFSTAGERSCADGVALAMVRRLGQYAGPDEAIRTAIAQLCGWVSASIRLLGRAALESRAVTPDSGADPADWLDLARSGLSLEKPLAAFTSERGAVGLCWWLSAVPPCVDVLVALVESAPEHRAVFGLVTAAELERVGADSTLRRDAEERRRRRPLPIRACR